MSAVGIGKITAEAMIKGQLTEIELYGVGYIPERANRLWTPRLGINTRTVRGIWPEADKCTKSRPIRMDH